MSRKLYSKRQLSEIVNLLNKFASTDIALVSDASPFDSKRYYIDWCDEKKKWGVYKKFDGWRKL